MSIKIMDRVWRTSSCEGSQLLLLLALADHASDDGVCWPGIPSLAHKIRKTERYTKALLKKLEASGEIHVARNAGRGNTNMYLVTLGLTADQITHTLTKRFGTDPNRAEYIAQTIAHRLKKGDAQDTILTESGIRKGEPPCQKGDPQCEKVIPSGGKGEPQSTRTVMNHQENHQENHQKTANAPSGTAPDPPKPQTNKQHQARAMFSALAELCQIDWRVCSDEQRGALNQSEARLRKKAEATPDDLQQFGEWWDAHDWRGKKGDPPTPAQVREEWGKFIAWRNDTPRAHTDYHAYEDQFPNPDPVMPPNRLPQTADQILWDRIQTELQLGMTQATYDTWLRAATAQRTDGTLTITTANEYAQDWLEHRLRNTVERVVKRVAGEELTVIFAVAEPQSESGAA